MKRIFKEEDINIDIETIFNLINDIGSYQTIYHGAQKQKLI